MMKINPNPKTLGKTDELNQYRIMFSVHSTLSTNETACNALMDILRSTQTADVTENNA